jgi:hypothetical protein
MEKPSPRGDHEAIPYQAWIKCYPYDVFHVLFNPSRGEMAFSDHLAEPLVNIIKIKIIAYHIIPAKPYDVGFSHFLCFRFSVALAQQIF